MEGEGERGTNGERTPRNSSTSASDIDSIMAGLTCSTTASGPMPSGGNHVPDAAAAERTLPTTTGGVCGELDLPDPAVDGGVDVRRAARQTIPGPRPERGHSRRWGGGGRGGGGRRGGRRSGARQLTFVSAAVDVAMPVAAAFAGVARPEQAAIPRT